MTPIDGGHYWDGGLFDNTPLGAVLDRLDDARGVDRTIYVVNLFPNEAPIPRNLLEVNERVRNLQFANKTLVKMSHRLNEVADLMEALEPLPEGNPLKGHPAYQAVAKRKYIRVPTIVSITCPELVGGYDARRFLAPDDQSARGRRICPNKKANCRRGSQKGSGEACCAAMSLPA